ncbi:hypothetical protein D3C75_1023710 [compost metagenome]
MVGAEQPGETDAQRGGQTAGQRQGQQDRPEQLADAPEVEEQRDGQGHRGRTEEHRKHAHAGAILGVVDAAQQQHSDHQGHRQQHRLQEHPAGTFEQRQGQLVGAEGDAEAEQWMIEDRLQGRSQSATHALPSARRCWRSISFCISQPANSMASSVDSTRVPASAQKSAAIAPA